VVSATGLPAQVGEVGNAGDIPHSAPIDTVTPDAIPVVETHHHDFFLLWAANPHPVTAGGGVNVSGRPFPVAEVLVAQSTPAVIAPRRGGGCHSENHDGQDRDGRIPEDGQ